MDFSRIRRASRYLARYREIFAVLVRYGLADWANRIDLDFIREIITRKTPKEFLALSTDERVRRALMELGPTFIKFGQILSVRPDLVGVSLSDELKKLQSSVDPDAWEDVEKTLETELGKPVADVFDKLEKKPVASASIGQVHLGWLKTGEKVAVKVRHKDIEKIVNTDIDILTDLASLLEKYVEEARLYRPKKTVGQFARTIRREMNFDREARHILNLFEDFADDDTTTIPAVYEEYTTSRVLVMEWLEGIPFNQIQDDDSTGVDKQDLAIKGANIFLKMIFINGYYHADPHPGNLMVCQGGRIGLLDFGMMGRLSRKMREHIEDLAMAALARDSDRLAKVIIRAGSAPVDLDETGLGIDIADFISYYGSLPIEKIKLFEALNELVSIIHRHHIMLPAEIMMLIKTLVTLEGTGRILSPKFDLLSLLGPYQEQMNLVGFSLTRRMARLNRFYEELSNFAETVPPALADIIERFRAGALEIHMEHRGLEHSANKLVFGIITAALFIGSSMILSFKTPPLIFGFSVLGVAGYVISVLMGLRILWAIMISGKLD